MMFFTLVFKNCCYLNGSAKKVLDKLHRVIEICVQLLLDLNLSKCDIIAREEFIFNKIKSNLFNCKNVHPDNAELL